ncbi:phosphate ABC transporter permease subunit PstC [Aeromicrobium sp. A1-2]|uniref:phosphate ABC transporter permease subunit PstC n=1 Tax=Aeromicrobium sp. A1-2 TaxID=2107713 RepID=UPI000E48203E|nr:phosphate ABC transporter permease subunit PstC [Aeromicrobium sp. A1-2]AXT86083.1 phosphate ABC transporter permease subunit PstC [Aeromicrobium sp. A1-2]
MTSTLAPPKRTVVRRPGDRVFSGLSTGAGILILVVLAGVAAFLTIEGIPGILANPDEVKSGQSFLPYVWPLVYGTLIAATVALIIAVPVAVGVALFISHYAPRKLGQTLGYLVDLLAAVPSVVYGLWGIQFLAPNLVPFYEWLEKNLGFIPFFAGPASTTGRTIMTACIVLAVMILPIMTAICREIFLQTPRLHEEAALALGATRWEMARLAISPYARSGIVSAAMLGLGRALGETLAVAMVLSVSAGTVTANLISSTNPSTIAANIALSFSEASGKSVNALIASGLVLFVITFLVNFAARAVVDRRKEFSGAN